MALFNPKTVKHVQDLVKADEVVNAYTKWVLGLKEDRITQLPDFEIVGQHLKTAKAHALCWQNEVYPMYQKTTSGILDFSESFCKSIQNLQQSILVTGCFDSLELNKLIAAVQAQTSNIDKIKVEIMQVGKEQEEDMRNFHSDVEKAQLHIVGDEKELQSLQDQLNSIEKAITRDEAIMAGGIFCIWLAVGAGIDLKKQEDAKKSVEAKKAMLKHELTIISSFKVCYDQLSAAGESVALALSTLQEGWYYLIDDVQEVIQKLQEFSHTDAAAYLKPLLDAALKDWLIVVEETKKL